MPFLQLQKLLHFRKDADSPLGLGCEYVFTRDFGKVTAELKHLYAWRLFEFDAVTCVFLDAW